MILLCLQYLYSLFVFRHYNYIVVIGKKEVEFNLINLRNPKIEFSFDDFVKFLEIQNKN